ncbi:composite domain of metallo-dependent hydrolase, partial [Melanomma pulvis-pyrius CBS 109.77]
LLLSRQDFAYGQKQCTRNAIRPRTDHGLAARRLNAQTVGPKTVIFNATLIDGDGTVTKDVNIEIIENIFIAIVKTSNLTHSEEDLVIDVNGRYVTPGLIDMHSHAGVREEPQLWATEDVTEVSAPVTPWGRAVDALKPHDQAIQIINSGGVTTSLVLTGAKNCISGEGAVIKMKRTDSIPDLLMNLTESDPLGKPQRYLKMAMGENQKRQFQGSTTGPTTRIGESYWFRHAYEMATRIKHTQDRWCELAASEEGRTALTESYPKSLEWQTLVDVLRGDVRVNVHGYETEDIFAMFDHADGYGFNITALHHALHSDLIAKEIKRRNITIVGFSDSWGDKKELYNVSSYMLRTVAEYDIPVVLTRDHPAEHGQWLAYEAQIGHHFGLPADLAIASVIAEPARAMGLDNRIGFVRPGYDADLVIWDRNPLQVGATPLEVFIDGISTVNASQSVWKNREQLLMHAFQPTSRPEVVNDLAVCEDGQEDIIIRGIKKSFIKKGGLRGDEIIGDNMTAVIRYGRLVCVGESICESHVAEAKKDSIPVMDLRNGYILPASMSYTNSPLGLTIATRQHGLAEMRQEPSTTDGMSRGNNWAHPYSSALGIRFGGIHLERAHRGGITRIITPPLSEGFFHGLSTCFRSGATNILDDGTIVSDQVALHFTIGHDAKQPETPTITSQLNLLQHLLTTQKSLHPIYSQAASGFLPIIVHTHNRDTIGSLIRLKRTTLNATNLIIMGGSEAHLVAHDLASANIPIILAPWSCVPLFWESRQCLPGPPLTDHLGAEILIDAGVKVALSNWDDTNNHVRNAIWEAAWIAGPRNESLALDLVSLNLEEMLGLPKMADLVVYEGNPFQFGASAALIFESGSIRSCWPGPD